MVLVRGGIQVKPHVQRCADAVVAAFGESLSPGTYNGHSPPEGPTQALDLFTPETAAGYALQGSICNWLIQNQQEYNVRYCIHGTPNGTDRIWNIERATEGFRVMTTRDHRNHVHVTFYADDPGHMSPPVLSTLTMKELSEMDFMYQFKGEDFIFLASAHYYGRLPFGDLLDGLSKAKLVHAFGPVSDNFHSGVQALAAAADMTGI